MIANRPDWTLSRQRQWGVPLPFFVDKETDELHPDTPALLELAASKVERGGIESWFEATHEDFGVDPAKYRKLTDTLDVWFDSGSTHQTVMGGPEGRKTGAGSHPQETGFPADLYLEGSDQHRGWFHSSLLVSCMRNGVPPYKALLTHGFAVDGDGKKMSKSKGNVVAPQKVSDTLGAEILRLWVGRHRLLRRSLDFRRDPEARRRRATGASATRCVSCSPTPAISTRRATPFQSASSSSSTAMRSRRCARSPTPAAPITTATNSISSVQRLQTYCSEDLGGFYLDVLKDRLYTAATRSRARRSAQTALALIRDTLLEPDGADSVVHRRGGLAHRASGRCDDLRAHLRPMRCRKLPDAAALLDEVAAHPRRARRGAEGARGTAPGRARSARRCRPK